MKLRKFEDFPRIYSLHKSKVVHNHIYCPMNCSFTKYIRDITLEILNWFYANANTSTWRCEKISISLLLPIFLSLRWKGNSLCWAKKFTFVVYFKLRLLTQLRYHFWHIIVPEFKISLNLYTMIKCYLEFFHHIQKS